MGQTIGVSLGSGTSMRQSALGALATATSINLSGLVASATTGISLATGDLSIDGTNVAAGTYSTAAALASAINTAYTASGGTGTLATANGNAIDFSNSSTSSTVAIGGTASPFGGLSVVPVATTGTTPTVDSASVTAADFNTFEITDLTVTLDLGSPITVPVPAGNYTNVTLAAAINTALTASDSGTPQTVAYVSGDSIRFGPTGLAATVTLAGVDVSSLGITDAVISSSDMETISSTVFDQFEVTDLTIAGTPVAAGSYNAAGLAGAINSAYTTSGGSGTLAVASGGGITFTNASASAIAFGGTTDNAALGITSLAAASVSTTNGSASTGDLTTALAAPSTGIPLSITDLTITLGANSPVSVTGSFATQQELVDAINTALGGNGFASLNSTAQTLSFTSGADIAISGADAATVFGSNTNATKTDSLTVANVLTVEDSNTTIQRVDSALSAVSTLRSTFGAIQNRFESVIANLATTSENLAASRSRVQDADFAAETANLSRSQILQQAGTAMVAQANQLPQGVLALLR